MFTIDTLHESFINRVKDPQLRRSLFIEKAILCGFSQSQIRDFIHSGNSIFNSHNVENDVLYTSYEIYP